MKVATEPEDSDIDLMQQVLLNRISAEIDDNALLSNFTVLAVTECFAFVVVFKRKVEFFHEPEDGVFEVITFRPFGTLTC